MLSIYTTFAISRSCYDEKSPVRGYAYGAVFASQMCIRDRCKYYSARHRCQDFELEGHPGFYAIGDGAGFTRSLSQAAANGLYVADKLSQDNLS